MPPADVRVAPAPTGFARLAWLGPGFLWMVSAAGSGEILFTPRIGAMYGYALLWAMVAAIALKWVINREIGRFAVCTGRSVLAGFSDLRFGRAALWLVLGPQCLVAIAAPAGMAGAAATALILVLPGDVRAWMTASVLTSTALVFYGRYRVIERAAMTIGVALALAAIVAAVSVAPDPAALAAGFVPALPREVRHEEVLPWLGFMLSGAAGLIWYSYWVTAKGYGLSGTKAEAARTTLTDTERGRLRGWIAQMTFDNTVAVGGTVLVAGAFLVLGTELLRPRGLVPEERRVAANLGHLLGGVWGPIGYWFMVAAVFVGFWDTILSDQDGHARMFTDGLRRLIPRLRRVDERRLRRAIVASLVTACPVALYLAVGEPVILLKIAGAIEAAHIPFVTALVVYLNRTALPADLRPSVTTTILAAVAAAFFAVFAGYYVWELVDAT